MGTRDDGKDAIMDYIEPGHEVALLWMPSKENDGAKGQSHLLELILDHGSEATSSSTTAHLHSDVIDLLHDMSDALKEMKGVECLSKAVHDIKSANNASCTNAQYSLLRWTDANTEARQLNHRHILGEDILTFEYDELVNDQKKKRQRDENIWTWDDIGWWK